MSHNGPINFHARALDQDAQPVPGVSLAVVVERYDRMRLLGLDRSSKETSLREEIVLQSDAEGWFHLSGKTGHLLKIKSIEKPGYIWRSDIYLHYDYMPKYMPTNAFYADAKQGVVFNLWRMGQTEPLVPVNYSVLLSRVRSNVFMNLFSGVALSPAGADLQFSLLYLFPGDTQRPADRRYVVRGLEGAFLVMKDVPHGYEAPQSGYDQEFVEERIVSHPKSVSPPEWTRFLFVRARNGGVYASLKIHFISGDSRFEISGYLNPFGSRLLEPDPSKLITDPAEIRRLDEATRVK